MGIKDDLEATTKDLSKRRMGVGEGAGHNFGKSKVNRQARGESTRPAKEIYDENMKSEKRNAKR